VGLVVIKKQGKKKNICRCFSDSTIGSEFLKDEAIQILASVRFGNLK